MRPMFNSSVLLIGKIRIWHSETPRMNVDCDQEKLSKSSLRKVANEDMDDTILAIPSVLSNRIDRRLAIGRCISEILSNLCDIVIENFVKSICYINYSQMSTLRITKYYGTLF